jgi:hypothetical protein
MTDQRIAKWTRWINGTIKTDVLTMHLQRDAWIEVSKILQENGQLPDSYWWEFMVDTYIVAQAVAVRRQADAHRDAASLRNLIAQVADDPTRITCELWLDFWGDLSDDFDRTYATAQWTSEYGGSLGTHLDPAIPKRDLDALTTAATKVRGYVDRHIAHAQSWRCPRPSPCTSGKCMR